MVAGEGGRSGGEREAEKEREWTGERGGRLRERERESEMVKIWAYFSIYTSFFWALVFLGLHLSQIEIFLFGLLSHFNFQIFKFVRSVC